MKTRTTGATSITHSELHEKREELYGTDLYFKCEDCDCSVGDKNFVMVMLWDDVWLSITEDPSIVLCHKCIEKRLDREIEVGDVGYSLGNYPIPCNLRFFRETNRLEDLKIYENGR